MNHVDSSGNASGAARCANEHHGIPLWVWCVSAFLASIVPLVHFWIWYFPKPGTVPTGLIGVDGVSFIHFLRMLRTGFYSPYASCHAPHGAHYLGYFVSPAQWIYGMIGFVGAWLTNNDFLLLGVANGLATMLYLVTVYLFLREVVPAQAPVAFLLFALGGGPSGLIFIVSGLLGLNQSPMFEDLFQRFTYALIEGNPSLKLVRLYYTIPLAMSMGGLVALVRGIRMSSTWRLLAAGMCLGLGAFLNLRTGLMTWAIALLYLYLCTSASTTRRRWGIALSVTFAVAVGELAGWAVTTLNQIQVSYILHRGAITVDVSSFAVEIVLFLPWLVPELRRSLPALPGPGRIAAYAAAGYLAAFVALYCAYQTYYGNWVVARNYAVTVAISDWALWGALIGAGWGARRKAVEVADDKRATSGWAALWFLVFLCGGVAGIGHGWTMRLNPERLSVLLGLPVCILAAAALNRSRHAAPRLTRAGLTVLVIGGVTSTGVAALYYIGPLEKTPSQGPYESVSWMSARNARVLENLHEGRVLAPVLPHSYFSDAISLRPQVQVVFGAGAAGLSDVHFEDMLSNMKTFFSGGASDDFRRDFVKQWCVDYVFCPESDGVAQSVVKGLRLLPWLEVVAEEGQSVLFRINPKRLFTDTVVPETSASSTRPDAARRKEGV